MSGFPFCLRISYLLPLQRNGSSLVTFSGKIFSNSISKTPFNVNDQLFRHKTHANSVWHKVTTNKSNVFPSL